MSTWTTAVLTNKGEVLLSKLTAGNTLRITRAVSGSGYVDPANLKSATAVSSPKQTLTMRTIRYPEPGECSLPVSLTNNGLSTGYTATQVGVFAQDPDEGEILYFIAQAMSGSGTEIPAESTIKGFSAEWVFYFQYGQADGVTVTVDPSNSVSYEEFLAAIQDIYAALALKAAQTDLDTTNANLNNKLSKSGGIMTGMIQMQTEHYISTPVKVTDSSSGGQLLVIGAGGSAVVGAGESPDALVNNTGITGEAENLYLSADKKVEIFVGCETLANRKSVIIDEDGKITVQAQPTDNMHLATKQYVDSAAATKQKTITSGTSTPSGGSSGDIYIQY